MSHACNIDLLANTAPVGEDEIGELPSPTQPAETESDALLLALSDPTIWGFLEPDSTNASRIKFARWKTTWSIGRGVWNDSYIDHRHIGEYHCTVEWDGGDGPDSKVTITNHSSKGTTIGSKKLARGQSRILRNRDVVVFGNSKDYRYTFRRSSREPTGFQAAYDLQPGSVVGEGAFGVVVKVLHKQRGDWYAVKILDILKRTADAKCPEARETRTEGICRELTILQSLKHRNICQFEEYFVEGGKVCLVLELVPGGNLSDYVSAHHHHQPMRPSKARYFTYQLCDAIAYIHGERIAHRDLKPANVLLTNDDPPIVKVADFGLSKALDGESKFKSFCGTKKYMAPEVRLRSPGGYTLLVDSWSLGIMVFQLLANDVPRLEYVSKKDSPGHESNDDYAPGWDPEPPAEQRLVGWHYLDEHNVCAQGKDFLERLLEQDPSKRMSPAEAREHPWLLEQAKDPYRIHSENDPESEGGSPGSHAEAGVHPAYQVGKQSQSGQEDGGKSHDSRSSAVSPFLDTDASVSLTDFVLTKVWDDGPRGAPSGRSHSDAGPPRKKPRLSSPQLSASKGPGDAHEDTDRRVPSVRSIDAPPPRPADGKGNSASASLSTLKRRRSLGSTAGDDVAADGRGL